MTEVSWKDIGIWNGQKDLGGTERIARGRGIWKGQRDPVGIEKLKIDKWGFGG